MKQNRLLLLCLAVCLMFGSTACSSDDPADPGAIRERMAEIAKAAQASAAVSNGEIAASRSTEDQFDKEAHMLSSEATLLFERTDRGVDYRETIAYTADGKAGERYDYRRVDGQYALRQENGWKRTPSAPGEEGDASQAVPVDDAAKLPLGASILWNPAEWYADPAKIQPYITSIERSEGKDGTTIYRVNNKPIDKDRNGTIDDESYLIYHIDGGLLVYAEYYSKASPFPEIGTPFTKTVHYITELRSHDDPAVKIDRTAVLPD